MVHSRPKITVSLHTKGSAYQQAEAQAAQVTARVYGFDVSVIYAEGDAIDQSDQLLKLIYGPQSMRPDVIVLEPVGTGMVRVAREAAKAGIGWVVLNREVDYISELRAMTSAPAFAVTTDHLEAGRIQGQQMSALFPRGGTALLLQGPSSHPVAQARTRGLLQTKNANFKVHNLIGYWQESVACDVVVSWLKMSKSSDLCVVVAQNDFMAMGARKACSQVRPSQQGTSKIKCIGCDGLETYGRRWTSEGLLDATILCPSLSSLALDVLAKELKDGTRGQPVMLARPLPYPDLDQLLPTI